MILGIDASNIRAGGGLTHLSEMLAFSAPQEAGFKKVVVWGSENTLSKLPNKDWLDLVHVSQLDRGLLSRIYWQRVTFPVLADKNCDVLFVPGGSYSRSATPVVTMSQNLLPFEAKEFIRYGFSWVFIRLLLLRFVQARSFKKADGVIYLTKYAHKAVTELIGDIRGKHAIIPHGINKDFFSPPKLQLDIEQYSFDQPFKLYYVSIVDMYKHQWRVVAAVAQLRNESLPVELHLIGPSYPPALKKLEQSLNQFDPAGEFVHYHGAVAYADLPSHTAKADGAIFASTCENLPIILLEAMASGVPIACSDFGPMPEVLRDAGVYFDPENENSIYQALRLLLRDDKLREKSANLAYGYAMNYSWEKCARETLAFLFAVAQDNQSALNANFR